MTDPKIENGLRNLGNAIERLREALTAIEASGLLVDATIQRFEFVIELFWKTLMRILSAEGIIVSTPRESIRKAFQIGWLRDETAWLQMLHDRNETSHVYDESAARRIYENIRSRFPEIEWTFAFLSDRFKTG